MNFELVPIDSLVPHPENRRRGDIPKIAESIRSHGFQGAVLCQLSSRRIIAGEHRWRAAQSEGMTEIPVLWTDVDDDTALRLMLADNAASDAATYDEAGLADLLERVRVSDRGLVGTGWDDTSTRELLTRVRALDRRLNPDDEGEIPPLPPDPTTHWGDLWILGQHRLICGDATDEATVDRALDGTRLTGAVVTDPPYGVGIGAKNRALDVIDRADRALDDLAGDCGIEEVEQLWRSSFAVLHEVMAPGCPYYIFGPQGGDLGLLLLLLRDAGLSPRHILIWVKNRPSFSIGRLDYDYQHEPIVYGWKPGGGHPWHADGARSSILNYDRPQASPDHPTVKPSALLEHFIGNSTQAGDWVLDPFVGSGSTLVACEALGRRCAAVEISPRYVDLTISRWERLTGQVAERVT